MGVVFYIADICIFYALTDKVKWWKFIVWDALDYRNA